MAQFEGLTTEGTLERSVAGVGGQVRHQSTHVRKRLPAELADDGAALWRRVHRRPRRRRRVVHFEAQILGGRVEGGLLLWFRTRPVSLLLLLLRIEGGERRL